MKPQILGVIGWSGSGKTTLLEYLLPRLTEHGLRANVVKHSHHDLILEAPHKDSARLRAAGAAEVLLTSPFRYALMHELRGAKEPPLAEQIKRLAPADLTLVEGFKWEPIPKIEVYRPALGHPSLHSNDPDVVAVASDVEAPTDLRPKLAWLDLNRPEQVLAWLLDFMKAGRGAA